MNYYPFHVGDYAAHTAHLEPMEDLAYRRLLDQYYLRECPLPADIQATAKLVRMRSCVADVEAVLNEFFVLTEDGWKHSRCDAEIERMQDKQAKARASAQASVNARKAKSLNGRSTDGSDSSNERSTDAEKKQTDVELPTPTPTPIEERDKSLLSPELPATADGAEIETHEAQTQPGAERLPNCPHDELLSLFCKTPAHLAQAKAGAVGWRPGGGPAGPVALGADSQKGQRPALRHEPGRGPCVVLPVLRLCLGK